MMLLSSDHPYSNWLEYLMESKDIDTIINFAAESHVDRSIVNPDDHIHTNINGTYNLLRLLHKYPVKRYVQISTDEVYGSLKEDDKPFNKGIILKDASTYIAITAKNFSKGTWVKLI